MKMQIRIPLGGGSMTFRYLDCGDKATDDQIAKAAVKSLDEFIEKARHSNSLAMYPWDPVVKFPARIHVVEYSRKSMRAKRGGRKLVFRRSSVVAKFFSGRKIEAISYVHEAQ